MFEIRKVLKSSFCYGQLHLIREHCKVVLKDKYFDMKEDTVRDL